MSDPTIPIDPADLVVVKAFQCYTEGCEDYGNPHDCYDDHITEPICSYCMNPTMEVPLP